MQAEKRAKGAVSQRVRIAALPPAFDIPITPSHREIQTRRCSETRIRGFLGSAGISVGLGLSLVRAGRNGEFDDASDV
jgi:hypothetical protein